MNYFSPVRGGGVWDFSNSGDILFQPHPGTTENNLITNS
jgi:hypothetical protein